MQGIRSVAGRAIQDGPGAVRVADREWFAAGWTKLPRSRLRWFGQGSIPHAPCTLVECGRAVESLMCVAANLVHGRPAPQPERCSASSAQSGQVSPIPSRTSSIALRASSGERPGGGLSRPIRSARAWAWGSARSCIQPWCSHSRIAPASLRRAIAQPRRVRMAGRRCWLVSMAILRQQSGNPRCLPGVPSCSHRSGIRE